MHSHIAFILHSQSIPSRKNIPTKTWKRLFKDWKPRPRRKCSIRRGTSKFKEKLTSTSLHSTPSEDTFTRYYHIHHTFTAQAALRLVPMLRNVSLGRIGYAAAACSRRDMDPAAAALAQVPYVQRLKPPSLITANHSGYNIISTIGSAMPIPPSSQAKAFARAVPRRTAPPIRAVGSDRRPLLARAMGCQPGRRRTRARRGKQRASAPACSRR